MTLLEAFESLGERRVLLFGGKGGVGKTTISAAAALHHAAARKTVLFSTDPASNLADLFADDRRATGKLTIEQLDAPQLYGRFLDQNLASLLEIGDRGTYLDREELRRFFELSLPGVDEMMAWMRIGELAEQNEDALIVVDTAPTGHALRMLDAAEHFRQFAVALDTLEEKRRDMVRQLTRRQVRDEIDDFIENFTQTARRRRDLLTDPARAAFIPIFLSEPWVVEQTLRLIDEVRQDGLHVPLAILNRAVLQIDCRLCTARAARDGTARERLSQLAVVDAARACAPLDSPDALLRWAQSRSSKNG